MVQLKSSSVRLSSCLVIVFIALSCWYKSMTCSLLLRASHMPETVCVYFFLYFSLPPFEIGSTTNRFSQMRKPRYLDIKKMYPRKLTQLMRDGAGLEPSLSDCIAETIHHCPLLPLPLPNQCV